MKKFLFPALLALTLPAAAQDIGTVGSLQPAINGTPPGASARALAVGLNVVANERIASTASGRGQLLFKDQTTLTIAPNSEIVLDSYVYDPAADSGDVAVSLTKGALRFIGGRITKKTDGTVRTPTATIGIRGGIALIDLLSGGPRVIFIAGEYVCIEGGTGRHCAQRTGAILTPEGYQGQVDPETLASLLRELDGEADPISRQTRFAVGSDDVGPANKPPLSTTGEERDLVIIEDDIRQELFDDRGFGFGARGNPPGNTSFIEPGGEPYFPDPSIPTSPGPTSPTFDPNDPRFL